ncbi:hypothetical protein KC845_03835 [Candidatus Kaiserbacteria bacterium]|nr:hypothetical protein [Candidatus Kaiserbacteria bacterium]
MYFLIIGILFFCGFTSANLAEAVEFVAPASPNDNLNIDLEQASEWYFGELIGFPHTYSFKLTEPTEVGFSILVPDVKGASDNRGAIIVRKVTRGVEAVTRLKASETDWLEYKDKATNDEYRSGPHYKAELPAGDYLIEVNTPDNIGKYVLRFNDGDSLAGLNYFLKLKTSLAIKRWHEKSILSVIFTPLLFWPVMIVMTVFIFILYRRRYA